MLSLTTKHKNLNLILVRSVLLTESSIFFFGGGGLSFILRDFFIKGDYCGGSGTRMSELSNIIKFIIKHNQVKLCSKMITAMNFAPFR